MDHLTIFVSSARIQSSATRYPFLAIFMVQTTRYQPYFARIVGFNRAHLTARRRNEAGYISDRHPSLQSYPVVRA
jgi:hypothetical protein